MHCVVASTPEQLPNERLAINPDSFMQLPRVPVHVRSIYGLKSRSSHVRAEGKQAFWLLSRISQRPVAR